MCTSRGNGGGGGGNNIRVSTEGLPQIVGTEKQIKYANDIRDKYISDFNEELDKIPNSLEEYTDNPRIKYHDTWEIAEMIDHPVERADYFGKNVSDYTRDKEYSAKVRNRIENFESSYSRLDDDRKKYKKDKNIDMRKAMNPTYRKIVNEYKETAIKHMNEYLKNEGATSASMWINNYKGILYN